MRGVVNDDPSPRPTRERSLRKPLAVLLAIVAPFVGVALLEVGFRAFGPEVKSDWENPYVAFDGEAVFFRKWDTELAMPRPKGTYRVFTLGGSTTAGYGVDQSYTARL